MENVEKLIALWHQKDRTDEYKLELASLMIEEDEYFIINANQNPTSSQSPSQGVPLNFTNDGNDSFIRNVRLPDVYTRDNFFSKVNRNNTEDETILRVVEGNF